MELILATRKSKLAQTQTETVMAMLKEKHKIDAKKLLVVTEGDKRLDVTLDKIGGKGLFVKEIELALLEGKAQGAVHSMKDVPYELAEDFELVAMPEREDVRDLPKRLTQRKKLKIFAFEEERNFDINDWLNKYIFCWVYVLVGTTNMKIVDLNNGNDIDHEFQSTYTDYSLFARVKYGFKLLCYPLYRQYIDSSHTGNEFIVIKDQKIF